MKPFYFLNRNKTEKGKNNDLFSIVMIIQEAKVMSMIIH